MIDDANLLALPDRRPALIMGLVIFACVCATLALGYWVADWRLDPEEKGFWDIALKFVGGIVAVVGSAIAVTQYFDARRQAAAARIASARASFEESRRPFLELKRQVYLELIEATATISNRGAHDPVREEAEARFWRLFWGRVPLVIDDAVVDRVNDFHNMLDDKTDGEVLRNASMELARACRSALEFNAEFKIDPVVYGRGL